MAKAVITLQDSDNGSILVSVDHDGGFDHASHAHQHACLVLACVEELLERQGTAIGELGEMPMKKAAEPA